MQILAIRFPAKRKDIPFSRLSRKLDDNLCIDSISHEKLGMVGYDMDIFKGGVNTELLMNAVFNGKSFFIVLIKIYTLSDYV